MDLIECLTDPRDLPCLEAIHSKGLDPLLRGTQVWELANIDLSIQYTNNSIGSTMIVDGAVVSHGPDFHNIGYTRAFTVILAQGDTKIGL
jgi:hypothetical protein